MQIIAWPIHKNNREVWEMVALEYVDRASEIRMKIHEIKAVAEVFEDKFVSPADDMAILNIRHDHDMYVHLFSVLFDLICEAYNGADELHGLSDDETCGSEL